MKRARVGGWTCFDRGQRIEVRVAGKQNADRPRQMGQPAMSAASSPLPGPSLRKARLGGHRISSAAA